MRAMHHHGDDALAHLAIGDALTDRADHAGALIADDVRSRRHDTPGAVQRVAALDADRADVDEDAASVADGVRDLFVAEDLRSTRLVVDRCSHAPDLRQWLRTAARALHIAALYDGSAGADKVRDAVVSDQDQRRSSGSGSASHRSAAARPATRSASMAGLL